MAPRKRAHRRPHIPLATRARAVELARTLGSQKLAAKKTGMSEAQLSRTIAKERKLGSVADRPRSGRPRKIPEKSLNYIKLASARKVVRNAAEVQRELRDIEGVDVTVQTVRNMLQRSGLKTKRVVRREKLTAAHREQRVQFARRKLNDRHFDWDSVVFTDETSISRQETGRPEYVIDRISGPPVHVSDEPKIPHGGGKFNLWAALCPDGVFVWEIFDESLTAEKYREILETKLFPAAKRRFKQRAWVMQQDNARPHTGVGNTQWLKKEARARKFTIVQWPVNSPDLSPIEEFWLELKT